MLTIGKLARAAGVSVETLRYYERRGLLPAPERTPAGYRVYDEEAVRRVRFIRRAQRLGFTLHEIGTLLDLRGGSPERCARVEAHAEHTIERIDHRIAELRAMRRALSRLAAACETTPAADTCPILEALEEEALEEQALEEEALEEQARGPAI
ncbi:MAG: heavy metal-responsive transcriptional regulator [Gemmatimonadetes bacterium]|nr:MAG: heavy metal-responsive transcriptional regulator [Gemmatimonadota bacterium]